MDKEKDNTPDNKTNKGQNVPSGETGAGFPDIGSVIGKGVLTEAERVSAITSKAEKLATATYMVTSFMPDHDLLKTKIREATVDFLSDIYASSEASFYDRTEYYKRALGACAEISGFLSVAASVNLISGMNCSILNREYEGLKQSLKSFDGVVFAAGSLAGIAGDFLGESRDGEFLPASGRTGSYPLGEPGRKGQNLIKDKKTEGVSFIPRSAFTGGKSEKTGVFNKGQERPKSERRDNILKILKKKKEVTIKDISNAISGCSEKTIQRELSALVSDGVLKKEGEKRWSRYSLN